MFAIFKKDVSKRNRKVWACTKSGVHDRRNKKHGLASDLKQEGKLKKTDYQRRVEARRKGEQSEVHTIQSQHNHPPGLWLGVFPKYQLETLDKDQITKILMLHSSAQQLTQILYSTRS
jgi:hypothetical protein